MNTIDRMSILPGHDAYEAFIRAGGFQRYLVKLNGEERTDVITASALPYFSYVDVRKPGTKDPVERLYGHVEIVERKA